MFTNNIIIRYALPLGAAFYSFIQVLLIVYVTNTYGLEFYGLYALIIAVLVPANVLGLLGFKQYIGSNNFSIASIWKVDKSRNLFHFLIVLIASLYLAVTHSSMGYIVFFIATFKFSEAKYEVFTGMYQSINRKIDIGKMYLIRVLIFLISFFTLSLAQLSLEWFFIINSCLTLIHQYRLKVDIENVIAPNAVNMDEKFLTSCFGIVVFYLVTALLANLPRYYLGSLEDYVALGTYNIYFQELMIFNVFIIAIVNYYWGNVSNTFNSSFEKYERLKVSYVVRYSLMSAVFIIFNILFGLKLLALVIQEISTYLSIPWVIINFAFYFNFVSHILNNFNIVEGKSGLMALQSIGTIIVAIFFIYCLDGLESTLLVSILTGVIFFLKFCFGFYLCFYSKGERIEHKSF